MRSHKKIKLDKKLVEKLKNDTTKYIAVKYQLQSIGITHPTYLNIIRNGECRTDVRDRIVNYFKSLK